MTGPGGPPAPLPRPPEPAPDPRLPVHILTGFLGSGKTTLLNAVLARGGLGDTAVVVNELGEVAIDHLLVERSEDRLVELAGGCVCCAVRGDLAATLDDLLRRRGRGACPPFARVVIETTGLADPAPVLNLLVTDPGLAERTRAGAVLTTVDAVNGHATLDRFAEARKQAALADRILLTKSDLAPLASIQLAQRLRSLNPRAEIWQPDPGQAARLAAAMFRDPPAPGSLCAPCAPSRPAQHDHGIETFTLVRDAPVPGAALALLIELLAEQLGARLLRVKGLVALAERPQVPAVVQGAQHVYHPIDFLPAWPDADHRTRLVFITLGRPHAAAWVAQALDMLVAETEEMAARLRGRRDDVQEEGRRHA